MRQATSPGIDAEHVTDAGRGLESFAFLYWEYHQRIYAYLWIRTERQKDAADLTQQVFLEAWEGLSRFRGTPEQFPAWLFRIARNKHVDFLRRRRRVVPLDPMQPAAELIADEVVGREDLVRLQRLLFALDERKRELLALNQFGQWSGLKPSSSNLPLPSGVPPAGPYATFDWTHATYRSRFISFVHKDLGDRDGHKLQVLSSHENTLYKRFAKAGPALVIIGGYVFNGSVIPYGDLEDNLSAPFSFAAVQGALQRGEEGRFSALVQDVNGTSNVMTALICHADGEKPQSVCTRAIIRDLLKHVR